MLFGLLATLLLANNAVGAFKVEETSVQASINCGPWPVFQLSSLTSCEYPVINRSKLRPLERGRSAFLNTCLRCTDGICLAKNRDDLESHHSFNCKMLFLAPLAIGSVEETSMSRGGAARGATQDPYTQAFSAKVTYTIAANGRVVDLQVEEIEGVLEQSRVERIIQAGARRVRFLPLKINGVRHRITQIESQFMLP